MPILAVNTSAPGLLPDCSRIAPRLPPPRSPARRTNRRTNPGRTQLRQLGTTGAPGVVQAKRENPERLHLNLYKGRCTICPANRSPCLVTPD
jgi:hypothetical protein